MKYTLVNRKKSTEVTNNKEFVKWMRRNDMQYFPDNNEFMEAYSIRKSTFEKIELRFEDEDVFVEDLKKNNMLVVEEPTKWNIFKTKKD